MIDKLLVWAAWVGLATVLVGAFAISWQIGVLALGVELVLFANGKV
jgi:hypothetical protein